MCQEKISQGLESLACPASVCRAHADGSLMSTQDSSSCKLQKPRLNLFNQNKTGKEDMKKISTYKTPLFLFFSLISFPVCCLHSLTSTSLVITTGLPMAPTPKQSISIPTLLTDVLESSLTGYVWPGLGHMSILNQSLGPGDTLI